MTTTPTSSALQKAREIAKRQEDLRGTVVHESVSAADEAISSLNGAIVCAFPSIHAELEKVTAENAKLKENAESWNIICEGIKKERDSALKGYRGMREVIKSLRNGGCGRQRNQNYNGQNYKENCECCEVVRENIDEAMFLHDSPSNQ